MSKIKVEVKLAEPAAPVKEPMKEPVKWEFPCFARSVGSVGSVKSDCVLWVHSAMAGDCVSAISVSGFDAGYCSYTWDRKEWTPVPKEESKHWRVVIDAAGVRLEKEEPAVDDRPGYPWLGRAGCGREVLFLDDTALHNISAGRGWGCPDNGMGRLLRRQSDDDFHPCAGDVVITNRPGVEFPRLYAMGGDRDDVAMRVAPDAWWIVENGTLRPGISDDAIRLRTEPKDTPLPDGSSMTLTFT